MTLSQLLQLEDDLRQLASSNTHAKRLRDGLLRGKSRDEKVRTLAGLRSLLRDAKGDNWVGIDAEDPSWVRLRQYLQGWFRRHNLTWDGPIN